MALGTFPIKIISMAKMVATTILCSKISIPKMGEFHLLSQVMAEATLLEMNNF
jgi:hypothetical protein